MRYEMVREIFNECANNQMRDVFFEEVDIDDTDAYVRRFCTGGNVKCEKSVFPDGSVVYDLDSDGLLSRITFTEA